MVIEAEKRAVFKSLVHINDLGLLFCIGRSGEFLVHVWIAEVKMSWKLSESVIEKSTVRKIKREPGKNNAVHFGDPFPEAIENCPELKGVSNVRMTCDIFLDSSKLHWYLMVKPKLTGSNLPYFTLEITTNNVLKKGDMIPTMRIISADIGHSELNEQLITGGCTGSMAEHVMRAFQRDKSDRVQNIMLALGGHDAKIRGTKEDTTIKEVCEIADAVRRGMQYYRLLDNNCQHFCNNVLERLGLETERTTVGPTTTKVRNEDGRERNVDDVTEVFRIGPDSSRDGEMKGT